MGGREMQRKPWGLPAERERQAATDREQWRDKEERRSEGETKETNVSEMKTLFPTIQALSED